MRAAELNPLIQTSIHSRSRFSTPAHQVVVSFHRKHCSDIAARPTNVLPFRLYGASALHYNRARLQTAARYTPELNLNTYIMFIRYKLRVADFRPGADCV